MEEVLRIQREYGERGLPREIIRRCLCVIAGVLLLGAGAKYSDADAAPAAYAGSSTYGGTVSGRLPGLAFVSEKAGIGTFPAGKLKLAGLDLTPVMPDTVSTANIRKIPGTAGVTKKMIPADPVGKTAEPAAEPAEGLAADRGTKTFSAVETENGRPGTGGSIGLNNALAGNAVINGAADDAAVNGAVGDETTEKTPPATVTVSVYGNGGVPEVSTASVKTVSFTTDTLGIPARPGKLFDGWYTDAECTVPFSGLEEGCTALTLYAGWREFPGFISNDLGHITGCTGSMEAVQDGFLCLPHYENCTGIESGAFDGMEDGLFEIFIPANITYIEEGSFDSLDNLMYIEVSKDNPVYYSESGVLYYADGTEMAYPAGLKRFVGMGDF